MLLNRWVVDSPGLVAVALFGVGVLPDKLSAVAVKRATGICIPLCTVDLLDFLVVTAINGSVGRRDIHPVIIFEYDTEMIILISGLATLTPAIPNRSLWWSVDVGVHHIYFVDKYFNDCITRQPGEITPVPQHILHIRPLRRSEEHTSELQSRGHLVCRLLLETK